MIVLEDYQNIREERPDASQAAAAVKALSNSISLDSSTTMTELLESLEASIEILRASSKNPIAIQAGCDHFIRFATALQVNDIHLLRAKLIDYGQIFFDRSIKKRETIATLGLKFVTDDSTILIHSCILPQSLTNHTDSRVVMALLIKAATSNIRFNVLVTEARPGDLGHQAVKELSEYNIHCKLILDAAVGYFIGKVDMVLVGAEGIYSLLLTGVCENGGLVNQIGSYQIAVVAKASNTPFYVATESHKFLRMFPLSQYDICAPVYIDVVARGGRGEDRKRSRSLNQLTREEFVDYTPPQYISLLFTDMGVLTPAAASDELLRFFN